MWEKGDYSSREGIEMTATRARLRARRSVVLLAVPGLAMALVVGSAGSAASQPAAAPAATALAPTFARQVSASAGTTCQAKHFRLESFAKARRQAKRLVARMTLKQETTMMHGVGFGTVPSGTIGATAPIKKLHIPAINQQDGPAGIGDSVTGVTQLPAPQALAATFDPKAAACYGQVLGTEARGKGAELLYGPNINIDRVPQAGRNFETLGEDPFLTGSIGTQEVKGIQRSGEMAQLKHYAVYNQETNRNTPQDDSLVTQRTLHEIYLKAWRQVIRAASPAAVMCSYATVNGNAACQNRALIRTDLNKEMHFSGFLGSDYFATKSTVKAAKAGLDQQQPETTFFGSPLVAAVRAGAVKRSVVDEAVTRIITQMYRFRLFTDYPKGKIGDVVTTPGHAAIANSIAEEGTVLLKNAGGVLPVSPSTGSVAVIGPAGSAEPTTAGGGSANVLPPSVVTPLSGIRSASAAGRAVSYSQGLPTTAQLNDVPDADLSPAYPSGGNTAPFTSTLTAPQTGTYVIGFTEPDDYTPVDLSIDGHRLVTNPGTPPLFTYTASVHLTQGTTHTLTLSGPSKALVWSTPDVVQPDIDAAVSAAQSSHYAVVVVSDPQESEAADRATLSLPSAQDALISAVAAANPRTIVVIDAGAAVAMPWLSQVAAVVDAWYPGQADGDALAAVLLGKVNPSGHLPVTFPASLSATPISTPARFPGVNGKVHYTERLRVGYRWWDATSRTPMFPFGFGLSYTSFRYAAPRVHVRSAGSRAPVVTVSVRVRNTGSRAGTDVAQLYLGLPAAAGEPPRQLEAFHRVGLRAGQSKRVTFTLTGIQLARWSSGHYVIPAGRYRVYAGDSSALAQLPARGSFRLGHATRLR
jgi:beta-glucosidase